MVSWCSITVLWESQTLSVVLVLFKVHQTAPVEKITKSADPQQQSPVGVPLSNASLECGQWAWFLWEIQHCTSGMGTVLHHGDPMLCWAFADQTQPSNLIQMPDPTTWPGPANILSYIPYEGGLLITLNQTLFLVYLGNAALICLTSTSPLHLLRIWPVKLVSNTSSSSLHSLTKQDSPQSSHSDINTELPDHHCLQQPHKKPSLDTKILKHIDSRSIAAVLAISGVILPTLPGTTLASSKGFREDPVFRPVKNWHHTSFQHRSWWQRADVTTENTNATKVEESLLSFVDGFPQLTWRKRDLSTSIPQTLPYIPRRHHHTIHVTRRQIFSTTWSVFKHNNLAFGNIQFHFFCTTE